jgi:hypothetical protein
MAISSLIAEKMIEIGNKKKKKNKDNDEDQPKKEEKLLTEPTH